MKFQERTPRVARGSVRQWQPRRGPGRCFRCGEEGHFKRECQASQQGGRLAEAKLNHPQDTTGNGRGVVNTIVRVMGSFGQLLSSFTEVPIAAGGGRIQAKEICHQF